MERDIPLEHENMLKQMMGVPEDKPLPELVVSEYWRYKRLACRIDWTPSPGDLVNILFQIPKDLIAAETDVEQKMRSAAYLFTNKRIRHGHDVTYSWRKKQRAGKIIGVSRDMTMVTIQDSETGDEREVENSLVEVSAAVAAAT